MDTEGRALSWHTSIPQTSCKTPEVILSRNGFPRQNASQFKESRLHPGARLEQIYFQVQRSRGGKCSHLSCSLIVVLFTSLPVKILLFSYSICSVWFLKACLTSSMQHFCLRTKFQLIFLQQFQESVWAYWRHLWQQFHCLFLLLFF